VLEAFLIRMVTQIGIPERFRRIAAYFAGFLAVLALCAALWGAWTLFWRHHDAKVIEVSDAKRDAAIVPALDDAAQERAIDAVANLAAEKEREAVIAKAEASEAAKPVEQRAVIPPTTVALNCERLRRAYSAAELGKMARYREVCRS